MRVSPLGGWRETFADWAKEGARWRPERSMELSHTTEDGQDVVKVECKDKITFDGLWLNVPDLDLSKDPYLTVDVRPQDDFQLNVYFYDGTGHRNERQPDQEDRGRPVADGHLRLLRRRADAGQGRQPINAGWVTGVLLNFHPKLAWPFTRYSGTILFRNVRIGADADVPKRQPVAPSPRWRTRST